MKDLAKDEHQIMFYYNPDSSIAKQTLVYLQESRVPVLKVNVLKNPPTGRQWLEIAEELGMDISDLILKDHPVYIKQYHNADFDTNGWLKVIHFHPEVVDQPIAMRGDKTILVKTPTEILQLLNA